MAEQSHTPGPWMAAAKPSSIVGWPVVAKPMGRMICDVALAPKPAEISDGEWSKHYVEVEANARLIAAAPELLEALIESQGLDPLRMELEDCLDDEREALVAEIQKIEAKIEAAIAKATGGSA